MALSDREPGDPARAQRTDLGCDHGVDLSIKVDAGAYGHAHLRPGERCSRR